MSGGADSLRRRFFCPDRKFVVCMDFCVCICYTVKKTSGGRIWQREDTRKFP